MDTFHTWMSNMKFYEWKKSLIGDFIDEKNHWKDILWMTKSLIGHFMMEQIVRHVIDGRNFIDKT